MNEDITTIISELTAIHQNIIRVIEELYNSLADYLDPAKYQKKKRQFGFFSRNELSKYFKNAGSLNRVSREIQALGIKWQSLAETIISINGLQRENYLKHLKNIEVEIISYEKSVHEIHKEFRYIIEDMDKLIKRISVSINRRVIEIVEQDINLARRLNGELEQLSRRLEYNKLKIENAKGYYINEINSFIAKKRFNFRIDLSKISNLKGYLNIHLIYKNLLEGVNYTFEYALNRFDDPNRFFTYCNELIYKSLCLMIKNSEDMLRAIYSSYIQLNMSIYLIPLHNNSIRGFIKDKEPKVFMRQGKKIIIEVDSSYRLFRIWINITYLVDMLMEIQSDEQRIANLSGVLFHEMSHILDKKSQLEHSKTFSYIFLNKIRDEGLARFSQVVYNPNLVQDFKLVDKNLVNSDETLANIIKHNRYTFGFLMCLIIFYAEIKNQFPISLKDDELPNLLKYKEANLNAQIFLRKLRQLNTKQFVMYYLRATKQLGIHSFFSEEYISRFIGSVENLK